MSSTLVTLLRWWLDHKLPYTPEAMDEMFQLLIMPTIGAAIQAEQQEYGATFYSGSS